jgi:hypothetical protein
MKKIHYISFYLNQDEIEGRDLVVAAQSKISYIIESIQKAGYEVCVISTTLTKKGVGFSKGKEVRISAQESHIYLRAMSSQNIIFRIFKNTFMQLQLLFYLLKNVESNDIVLAYHSLAYMPVIKLFKKLRKNKFILELNDLYALHFTSSRKLLKIKKKECSFFNIADGFLFASPFMTELVNENKPAVISYGSYREFDKTKQLEDGKIHVVYSGVIENLRRAAKLVANTAMFLSKDYVIHIAGYGTEKNLKEFNILCNKINKTKGYEAIIFHGLLLGDDLDKLLDTCKIALNCHTYKKEDLWKSKFSFPSKIPLNMGHDLYLVSHNMQIISDSPFAQFITFFSEFSPKAVADSIMACVDKIKNIGTDYTPKHLIKKLDEDFVKDIKSLFAKL